VSISEETDELIGDSFAGAQQCINAFDLLQPTIKRQLESGMLVYQNLISMI